MPVFLTRYGKLDNYPKFSLKSEACEMLNTLNLKLAGLVVALAFVATACNENTNDPADPVAPAAPTALMATSVNESTVGLKWTPNTTGATITGFEVTIQEEGVVTTSTVTFAASTSAGDVSGLTEGKVYNFTVRALNSTAKSDPSNTMKWAPAKRYITNLRLYETDSPSGSGIQLPDLAGLVIASGGLWDLCLDTRGGSFDIGSPTKSSYTNEDPQPKFPNGDLARVTLLGKTYTDVVTLEDIYESVDLITAGTLQEALINFNTADTEGKAFAFVLKTAAGNFAKVLVKKSNGRLLQGTTPNRYVDLEISYQSGANIPYATVDNTPVNPFSKKIDGTIYTNVKKND